jgi:hypothetical protein
MMPKRNRELAGNSTATFTVLHLIMRSHEIASQRENCPSQSVPFISRDIHRITKQQQKQSASACTVNGFA